MMKADCTLIGIARNKPELSYTQSGLAVGKLIIDVEKKWKEKSNVETFEVTLFGKTAQIAADHVSADRTVVVMGELTSRRYTGKDGVERLAMNVNGRQIYLAQNNTETSLSEDAF
jgi:single-strand DNA-binding protein